MNTSLETPQCDSEWPNFGGLLARVLDHHGIRAVFTVPGVPIVESLNLVNSNSNTRVIVCKNEQNATNAATAYSYFSSQFMHPR